jgi:hypothetical protein
VAVGERSSPSAFTNFRAGARPLDLRIRTFRISPKLASVAIIDDPASS